MKNSFVLYTEHMQQVELLDFEQRGILFTALMYYAAGRELPEMDAVTSMVFSFIRAQIDKDTKNTRKQSISAGKQAGSAVWQKQTMRSMMWQMWHMLQMPSRCRQI